MVPATIKEVCKTTSEMRTPPLIRTLCMGLVAGDKPSEFSWLQLPSRSLVCKKSPWNEDTSFNQDIKTILGCPKGVGNRGVPLHIDLLFKHSTENWERDVMADEITINFAWTAGVNTHNHTIVNSHYSVIIIQSTFSISAHTSAGLTIVGCRDDTVTCLPVPVEEWSPNFTGGPNTAVALE